MRGAVTLSLCSQIYLLDKTALSLEIAKSCSHNLKQASSLGDGDWEINFPASHARDTDTNWLHLQAWEVPSCTYLMSLESADKAKLSSSTAAGGGWDIFKVAPSGLAPC